MTLHDRARQVHSRDDLVAFLQALSADLAANESQWANADLASFLEAMRAWVNDTREDLTTIPPSRMVASLLLAARGYE